MIIFFRNKIDAKVSPQSNVIIVDRLEFEDSGTFELN